MIPGNLRSDKLSEHFEAHNNKTDEEREALLREAVSLVSLQDDEIAALLSFCKDKNGVPYTAVNIGNLGFNEIHEAIVAVCMEIGRIKVDLVSEDEKKK
jgi:hypothetical protein